MNAVLAVNMKDLKSADLTQVRKELTTLIMIERGPQGLWRHPSLPKFDEFVNVREALMALGIEVAFASLAQQNSRLQGHYMNPTSEIYRNCSIWKPTPPPGGDWMLLEVFDAGQGPKAMFGRALPESFWKAKSRAARALEMRTNEAKRLNLRVLRLVDLCSIMATDDFEDVPEQFQDFLNEVTDLSSMSVHVQKVHRAINTPVVERTEPVEARLLLEKDGLKGMLFQVGLPIHSQDHTTSERAPWTYYYRTWVYGESFEDAWIEAIKWAEDKLKLSRFEAKTPMQIQRERDRALAAQRLTAVF